MDEQIHKKESILKELKRKVEERTLTQSDVVDLRQELERCNHIQNHIVRGYVNPAGRYLGSAAFAFVGLSYWMSTILNRGSILHYKTLLKTIPYVLIPAYVGYGLALRRFGDKKESNRFSNLNEDSREIDEEFYEIVDNIKKDRLKY